MIIYMVGAFTIAGVTTGLFLWSIITKQFVEDARLKEIPLEEDEV
jgi:hypothetical protein